MDTVATSHGTPDWAELQTNPLKKLPELSIKWWFRDIEDHAYKSLMESDDQIHTSHNSKSDRATKRVVQEKLVKRRDKLRLAILTIENEY